MHAQARLSSLSIAVLMRVVNGVKPAVSIVLTLRKYCGEPAWM
jgi:hypothetical protein